MKIHSARSSLAGWFLAVAAGLLVAACGGGGSGSSTGQFQGGAPVIQPDGATFYAGIPNSITVTGGRRPYTITFSEPDLLGVTNPVVLDGGGSGPLTFSFIPANPAVIDTGLPPGSLPVRTVNVQLRDAQGQVANPISFKVGQNFLLGYGVFLDSNCPSSGTTTPPACSGGETVVRLVSAINGNLYGDRQVRFEVVKGPFGFVQLPEGTIDSLGRYTTRTDHAGIATAVLKVDSNVSGQIAVLRIVDVATGVFVNEVFPISGGAQSKLTALPDTFSFVGANNTVCGTGTGQFMVLDGVPPYSALSSDPAVTVAPASTGANPAVFTISAQNPGACVDAFIVVTDSAGGRVSVEVKTTKGSGSIPAPPAVKVTPNSITLACGTSGSVSVVGGAGGGYILNSTHPRVTAVSSGNTITITRLAGDGATSYPTSGTVSVTDGTTTDAVGVTVPANCP